MTYYFEALRKYAVFNGRTGRKAFWMFFLINFTILLGLNIIQAILIRMVDSLWILIVFNILSILYSLAVFLPGIAISARRLHDVGKSGWWLFVPFVPLVFLVMKSKPGTNDRN